MSGVIPNLLYSEWDKKELNWDSLATEKKLSQMLHGAGLFTNISPKNHPVWLVNIPAPWFADGFQDGQQKYVFFAAPRCGRSVSNHGIPARRQPRHTATCPLGERTGG